MYFESSKGGGFEGAVEDSWFVSEGIACIKLQTPEAATQILSKTSHSLYGSPLSIQYANIPSEELEATPTELYDHNKLLIPKLPPGLDQEYLQLFLDRTMRMEAEKNYCVEMRGELAIVTFVSHHSIEELADLITRIASRPLKGVTIQAQLCKISSSIRITNISKHYEKEYIQLYFEHHKKSGGGKVTSVELFGSGEAMVTFDDHEVMESVLERTHDTFGKAAIFERVTPLEFQGIETSSADASLSATPLSYNISSSTQPPEPQSIVVKVPPLVAKCLQKNLLGLQECIKEWQVNVDIKENDGIIQVFPTKYTISGWQQMCHEQIKRYTEMNIKEELLPFPKEGAHEVATFLLKIEATVAFSLSEDSTSLTIAAESSTAEMVEARVKEISSAYILTADNVPLSTEEYTFVSQVKMPDITGAHPDVEIKCDPADHALLVQGSMQNVADFKRCLPEYCSHNLILVELHPLIVQYIFTEDGRRQLLHFIQGKHCPVAIDFKSINQQPKLHFLCDPSLIEPARSVARALQQETHAIGHPLPPSFNSQLPDVGAEYYHCCQDLNEQYHVLILTTDREVKIAGFQPDVDTCSQSLMNFIKRVCTIVTENDIERGIWRLFCGPMHEKWVASLSNFEQRGLEVTVPDEDAMKPTIILKGDTALVERVSSDISRLEKAVFQGSVTLYRPGICKYFQDRTVLDGIEKQAKVCIEIAEVSSVGEFMESGQPSSQPTKVCVAHTKEHKQINIYIGDISEFDKADVIVNAANGILSHDGGVARAIADKGGPVIQEESDKHVKRHGKLEEGDVWLTVKVGSLPCKALIHAVGPTWKGGTQNEIAVLKKACKNSLQMAKKYRSIAFPAISSGIFSFPTNYCADALIAAVVEFAKNNPLADLQDINFVLFKPADAAFVNAIKKYLPPENIYLDTSCTAANSEGSLGQHNTAAIKSEASSKKKRKKRAAANIVKLCKGSLLDVKADVYVNTTNFDLDLAHGAVAQLLAKAAGPALIAECKQKAPVKVGGLAVTGGGNLPCSYIFHVVAPNYDGLGGPAEKVLRNLVQKCLKECSKHRVTSIAFPAIGTGNLRFPSSVVAKLMLREIFSFLSENKTLSLTEIHLVIFKTDTYQAFQQELASYQSEFAAHSQFPKSITPTKPMYSSSATPRVKLSPLEQTFPFGNGDMMVQIVQGDITEEITDVIVNPTDKTLQLGGPGVSGALLKKGGQELQTACNALLHAGVRLEEGKVLETPLPLHGRLKCKSIFHIMFESGESKKFVKTIGACLQRAEDRQFTSIAFPAIGTGVHRYPAEEVARAMMRAIQQFVGSKHTYVSAVRIVLFQPEIYQTFVAVFQEPEGPEPGVLTRIAKGIWDTIVPSWPTLGEDSAETAFPLQPAFRLQPDKTIHKVLELRIYGESAECVQMAEKKVQKVIDDQFITDKVDDPNVDELTPTEVAKLQQMSQEMHVEIDINPAPLNYIRLKGDKNEVQHMKFQILQVFINLEKQLSRKREAEQLQRVVQWKRVDSQDSESDYECETNFEVEQAFLSKKTHYTYASGTETYRIDFKKMEEIDCISSEKCGVVRVDLEKQYKEGERPSTWDPMPTDFFTNAEESLHVVNLTPSTEEYQKVLRDFNHTMQGCYRNIVCISRIQNPVQYAQYRVKKKEMDKHNPPGHLNERRLFHGTAVNTVPKINTQSFNRSFAGRNATAFGRGVYFARDAAYSAQDKYSPRDTSGNKFIYLARVLTGEFTEGNSTMLVPPAKNPQKDPNILFDSVVDNVYNPQIFVVFYDSHAYPEYLIVFT